jgi:putative N-acetylmannosamine-6-phosphate epimerase
MERSARHFLIIKAAKGIKKEIEKAGLENLKTLTKAGISIVGTYLNGCSPQEKERIRRDFNALVQMGVTPDMVLTELLKQTPGLAPAMEGKEGYKQSEIKSLELFLGK